MYICIYICICIQKHDVPHYSSLQHIVIPPFCKVFMSIPELMVHEPRHFKTNLFGEMYPSQLLRPPSCTSFSRGFQIWTDLLTSRAGPARLHARPLFLLPVCNSVCPAVPTSPCPPIRPSSRPPARPPTWRSKLLLEDLIMERPWSAIVPRPIPGRISPPLLHPRPP